jgi:hypothetical protein
MADTYTWLDRGGERVFHLDSPSQPGGRFLVVRRQAGGDDEWTAACVLQPGEPEREIGDGLAGAGVAEDAILKYAIQALARLHGVSPAPGLPDTEAGEAEVIISKLWQAITERWAPDGVVPGPPAGPPEE